MTDLQTLQALPRIFTNLPPQSRAFWTAGKDGKLVLLRNRKTGRWIHPLYRVADDDPDVTIEPVSGKGKIFTYTVNVHTYNPAVPPPYVIALVLLDEQDDLRIPANIVNCEPDEVHIDMPVRVVFEQHGEIFVPVFEPDR